MCARYHMYLLSIGQTTNEHLKRIYRDDLNPNNGGCVWNTAVICSENHVSKLPLLREKLTVEQYIHEIIPVDPESSSAQAANHLPSSSWTVVSHRNRGSLESEIKDNEDDVDDDYESSVDEDIGRNPDTTAAINNPIISR